MRRSIALFAIVATAIVSLVVGFWLGVREALPIGWIADAAPRGVMATGMLNQLKAGKAEHVVTLLESDVDGGLLWSHRLAESPLGPLLLPVWGFDAFPNNTEYVSRLANFRRVNPSPRKDDGFDTVPPDKEQYRDWYREMAKGVREDTRIINDMVTKYSTKQ